MGTNVLFMPPPHNLDASRTARVAFNNRPRGVPGTPSFAKECWKKEREENRDRSANYVDQDACNVDCTGFDTASLEVEKAVAPRTQGWQMVKPRAFCSSRVRDVPSCNHPHDQQRSNRYSPLMSSFSPPGSCHPIKEKNEDGDILVGDTMEVNVFDEKKNFGKITIDSGAAENVLPRDYLPGIPLQPSPGSQRGACFIAANGTRMELQIQGNHWRLCPR